MAAQGALSYLQRAVRCGRYSKPGYSPPQDWVKCRCGLGRVRTGWYEPGPIGPSGADALSWPVRAKR